MPGAGGIRWWCEPGFSSATHRVPLRDVLASLGAARARVEVDDPAVAIDLDAPDDVLLATGSPPRFA